jgi:hypothetical protein
MPLRSLSKSLLVFAFFLHSLLGNSQPRLTQEIEGLVQPLIEQINRYDDIKTVAIADFTTTDYQANLLGNHLADEVLTSMVMSLDRKFELVTREQLKVLLKEAKLGKTGIMAPENQAKLGRVKGIDLIIGATMTLSTSHARLNVTGVHLESGGFRAAGRANITLTNILRQLADNKGSENSSRYSNAPSHNPQGMVTSYTHQDLQIYCEGCKQILEGVRCNFLVDNKGRNNYLVVYGQHSYGETIQGRHTVSRVQLGSKIGRQKVGEDLKNNEPLPLIVDFSSLPSSASVNIKLSLFTNDHKNFTANFENISITP